MSNVSHVGGGPSLYPKPTREPDQERDIVVKQDSTHNVRTEGTGQAIAALRKEGGHINTYA